MHPRSRRFVPVLALVLSQAVLAEEPVLTGVVAERIEAGGYVYLRVKTTSAEAWAAVPEAALAVGAPVKVDVQAWMTSFESPSLKRRFERIAFGTVTPTVPSAPPGGAPNPHLAGLPRASPATPSLAGTVREKVDAAGYTYLRLALDEGGETWAAVPLAEVGVGAKVRIARPQPMDGFESRTLKRRFEHIVFGTLAAQ
ncbi:MAG: hypothetical protein U0228_03110 [Myxococcaceae bacterium]